MLRLRIVAPPDVVAPTLEVLRASGSACNIAHLESVAHDPDGDLARTSTSRRRGRSRCSELSAALVIFTVVARLIASVGIYLDSRRFIA